MFGANTASSDNSTAFAHCAQAASGSTFVISETGAATFKLLSYVHVLSGTTVQIIGTVDCSNRSGGLYCLNSTGVSFIGMGGGFTDSSVSANYINNEVNIGPVTTVAPGIHIRNSLDCLVRGVRFKYLSIGVWISDVSANTFTGPGTITFSAVASFTGSISGTTLTVTAVSSGSLSVGQLVSGGNVPAQTYIIGLGTGTGGTGTYTINNPQTLASQSLTSTPVSAQCTVEDCDIQYICGNGILSHNANDLMIARNYVYRCGDGGISSFAATNLQVVDNVRISPYGNGTDSPLLNDQLGISFEA
jgi:hypothetical protein